MLGSAVHNQTWLPEAADIRQGASPTTSRVNPTWLFSVCTVGETSSFLGPRTTRFIQRRRKETKELVSFRQAIRPRGHRYFAGAIEPTHWNVVGNLVLRCFGGTYGDHRDWQDIDAWAHDIARQLQQTAGIHE